MATAIFRQVTSTTSALRIQLGWFVTGAVFAFLMPLVFSSTLDLNHDLYYGVYFVGVAAFLTLYVRETGADPQAFVRRNLGWSLALGALATAFVVFNVLNREDSTPRPDGLYFVFELAWRGVAYGVVDALLLTAFPALVAYSLLEGRVETLARRGLFAGVALVLTLAITATYHLGYEQFRKDGIGPPEIGNTIISVPALATMNPLGSVVAHASMHVAAVTHAYETEVFLPPQTDAD